MRALTATVAAAAVLLSPPLVAGARPQAPALAAGTCSRDVLGVDGVAVSVTLCGTPAGARTLVEETFAAPGGSFTRELTVDRAGAATVRTVDDVALDRIGLKRTLHLTLAVHGNAASLLHAMALPGATILK